MREFREAQERRDRELLERDLDEVRQGATNREAEPGWDEGAPTEEDLDAGSPPGDEWDEEAPLDETAFDEPAFDEPPPDELMDEMPPEDAFPEDLPPEDLPPEDEELRWDPATGTWR